VNAASEAAAAASADAAGAPSLSAAGEARRQTNDKTAPDRAPRTEGALWITITRGETAAPKPTRVQKIREGVEVVEEVIEEVEEIACDADARETLATPHRSEERESIARWRVSGAPACVDNEKRRGREERSRRKESAREGGEVFQRRCNGSD